MDTGEMMKDSKLVHNEIAIKEDTLDAERLVKYFAEMWKRCSSSFPVFNDVYTLREKRKNESELDKFFKAIESEKKNRKDKLNDISGLDEKYSEVIRSFLYQRLNFPIEQVDISFSNNFLKITSEFIKAARTYDAEITSAEIFQACRNVWTMNWIQMLLGMKTELTPSVFAYSLLYPYTDNFIDAVGITSKYKMEFNKRVLARVNGEKIIPESANEEKIFDLLEMIESQYNRDKFPGVYKSLEAIQLAQMKSMNLADNTRTDEELLDISIEKGGTSVLADGYLVAGELNDSQKLFLFGYGAYLQLVDDLQDIMEDSTIGLKTYFAKAYYEDRLELMANQTYSFGKEVISYSKTFEADKIEMIINLMTRTNDLLIVDAIGLTTPFYKRKYLKDMQKYSPFRFSFMKRKQKNYLTQILQ